MEGVSLIPGSDRFVAAMQGPLIQDGRIEANKCLGIKNSIILGELNSNRTREIVYSLTDETTGISEILAVDSSRYLVLERDSGVGATALIKKIYLADLTGVTGRIECRVVTNPKFCEHQRSPQKGIYRFVNT